ncbi:MAG: hypothetical protein QXQ33_00685 [Nitrososphaerota archaeon]
MNKRQVVVIAALAILTTMLILLPLMSKVRIVVEIDDGLSARDSFGQNQPINVNVYVYKNGELVGKAHNIITNVGIKLFRDAIHVSNKTASDKARYMALSIDSTSPSYTDTTCPNEITSGGLERANATVTTQSGPQNGDITIRVENTFTATSSFNNIQKACLFTQLSGGTLYAEATFSPVSLQPDEQLTIRWDFSYTN